MMKTNKKSIYIHIPFCESKCNYCDFLSCHASNRTIDSYIGDLCSEMDLYREEFIDNRISTVFIGGGTPSILSALNISTLLERLYYNFSVDKDAEITIESNPNSLTSEMALHYKTMGINRISIGAQSFNDELLKDIGRIHKSSDVYRAIEYSKSAGFKNINLDLMMGLPNQNLNDIKESLIHLKSLDIEHISYYSLIFEEGTPLYKDYIYGKLSLPSEEEDREMYHYIVKELAEMGYNQYEISNFSKPGYQCDHNINYWKIEEYLGLGLGAHSNIGNKRFWNVSDLNDYKNCISQGKKPIKDKEVLSTADRINEFAIMGLRLNKGISIIEAKEKFNVDFLDYYRHEIKKNLKLYLIDYKDNHIFLTDRGRDISNIVELDFIK